MRGKHILIVDDEPAVGQLLKMLLESHGYSTEVLASWENALNCITMKSADLILIDLSLPNFESFKICRQLKMHAQAKDIPVIIVSGPDHAKASTRLELGADDYITKPFEPEILCGRIEALLRRRSLFIDNEETHESNAIMRELRNIIDHELIISHFQPIYNLKPFRLIGMEVLSRPQTESALSDPELLFEAALKYGVYFEVEMIGWRNALSQVSQVFKAEELFLNCKPCLLENEKFKTVRKIFDSYHMDPSHVFLEITERSAIINADSFFDRLLEYRKDGFRIAVDDIGSGYSSLGSIVQTHPDVVKFDRRIVDGLSTDSYKKSIVKLLVAFCRENSIICIAEGIETKTDFELLVELGVDAGQGYYLYRPTAQLDLKAMHNLATV